MLSASLNKTFPFLSFSNRGCIFRLSLSDLQVTQVADWNSDNETRQICVKKGFPEVTVYTPECDGSSDRSFIADPLSYFTFQPIYHNWCSKDCGMSYPVCLHSKSVCSWCNGLLDRSFMVGPLSYFSFQPVLLLSGSSSGPLAYV